MKAYDVTVTETLQMTVPIEAESLAEAEQIAEDNWNRSQYILDADQILRRKSASGIKEWNGRKGG